MNEFARQPDWTDAYAVHPEIYHIEATTSLVDRPLRTLKNGDLFGVFDRQGECIGIKGAPDGLFFRDTRHLSLFEISLGGQAPLLLSSVLLDNNSALTIDLTNADLHDDQGRLRVQRDSVHVARTRFLHGNICYERIRVSRFEPLAERFPIELRFGADFADLFEVRGETRPARGTTRVDRIDDGTIRFLYAGLDGVERGTTLRFDPRPDSLTARSARWDLDLAAQAGVHIDIAIVCDGDTTAPSPLTSRLPGAYRALRRTSRQRAARLDTVTSSNALANQVYRRAAADIDMLLTETEHGLYPYAGIPWYSTVFGRDGIITALQLLWTDPDIAKGVLWTLSRTQATAYDERADSEPGKIIHEMRGGEMAALGEVPFRRYYGSVDATPLFVMLAGAYHRRTGDLATVRALWPNIDAALRWIDTHGDRDGDGFVEYARQTEAGLANQGWKDSFDSVFHADGRLAEGPIALCEVQAYVFAARTEAAGIARALGMAERAEALAAQAETLRVAFETHFWDEELGCYVLALDGRKAPCRVLSSNAGHALFGGIASPERARRVAALLMGERFFTGWGISTVAVGQARYNPMSYHNGSVWPHDNALIALGFARYGLNGAALRLFQGLMEAATHDEFDRLPELFCGFPRRRNRGFVAYPVACSPQAWAAAAPFALLAATLGLEIDHAQACVRLRNPMLPPLMNEIVLRRISLGDARIDLAIRRGGADVITEVLRRDGAVGVAILK